MREIGPHRVTNFNVVDAGVHQLFDDGRKAEIFYSDPPWGEGNVKYWATKATKDTGREFKPVTYDRLLNAIFDLIARYVTDHVFFETGMRFEADIVERMEKIGLKSISRVQLSYGDGLKNVLLHGSFLSPGLMLSHLLDQSGAKVSEQCIEAVKAPGGIVFDPCCGMGYTARAARLAGMEFRGNELNPVRLEKTINRLTAGKVR